MKQLNAVIRTYVKKIIYSALFKIQFFYGFNKINESKLGQKVDSIKIP